MDGWIVRKDSGCAGVQGEGNVTSLLVSFGSDWAGLAKKATFWNARGENPVVRTLTADLLTDLASGELTYLLTIPPEPLVEAGECSIVLDGYTDGKRARSVAVTLSVKSAPGRAWGEPPDPTPSQAEQLQKQIDTLLADLSAQARIATDGAAKATGKAAEAAESELSAQKSAQAAAGSEANTKRDSGLAVQSAQAAAEAVLRAQAEADRATMPPVQGVYNVVLQDRVTGERYALVVEAGVLGLLGVSPKLDAVELAIVDSADGRAYALAVESGNLLLEEVS